MRTRRVRHYRYYRNNRPPTTPQQMNRTNKSSLVLQQRTQRRECTNSHWTKSRRNSINSERVLPRSTRNARLVEIRNISSATNTRRRTHLRRDIHRRIRRTHRVSRKTVIISRNIITERTCTWHRRRGHCLQSNKRHRCALSVALYANSNNNRRNDRNTRGGRSHRLAHDVLCPRKRRAYCLRRTNGRRHHNISRHQRKHKALRDVKRPSVRQRRHQLADTTSRRRRWHYKRSRPTDDWYSNDFANNRRLYADGMLRITDGKRIRTTDMMSRSRSACRRRRVNRPNSSRHFLQHVCHNARNMMRTSR